MRTMFASFVKKKKTTKEVSRFVRFDLKFLEIIFKTSSISLTIGQEINVTTRIRIQYAYFFIYF